MTVDSCESKEKLTYMYEAVSQWMKARKLKLNPGETEILLFGTTQRSNIFNEPSIFSLSDAEIPMSEKVSSLGVVTGNRNQEANSGEPYEHNLIVKFLDQRLRLNVVHGLILSSLKFCKSLYCELPNKKLRFLEMLIKSSAQMVKGFSH